MGAGNHTETLSVGGKLHQWSVDLTSDNDASYGDVAAPIVLAVGSVASSWVKTDADTAACDVPTASTIATGVVDVKWDAGIRYGVDCVRTVDALALDGGAGDDFPETAEDTVIVTQQQQVNVSIDGDLANLVSIKATCPAHVDCQDADGDSIRALTLVGNKPDMWDSKMSNVYTGDPITKAMVSNSTLYWVTSTSYAVNDFVLYSGTVYKCLVAHTSGTFATDLSAGDWEAVTCTIEFLVAQDSTP